jgi:hypothetical protein
MGVVYEAVHEQIGQRVAAKVLYLQLAQQPEYMERFVREARASSMIRHDGLAKIFDFGQMEGGPPYILMEFLEGDLLRTRMDHLPPPHRMDVPHALRIARQIASALAAAHAKGVVHRDPWPFDKERRRTTARRLQRPTPDHGGTAAHRLLFRADSRYDWEYGQDRHPCCGLHPGVDG